MWWLIKFSNRYACVSSSTVHTKTTSELSSIFTFAIFFYNLPHYLITMLLRNQWDVMRWNRENRTSNSYQSIHIFFYQKQSLPYFSYTPLNSITHCSHDDTVYYVLRASRSISKTHKQNNHYQVTYLKRRPI